MIYRTVRFVNLVLAGIEFGTWVAAHPSLAKLGQSERIRAGADGRALLGVHDRDMDSSLQKTLLQSTAR